MAPVEITAREVYDLVQQLHVRLAVLGEKVDRLELERRSRSSWWSVAAAWAAVLTIVLKDILV